MPSMFFRILGLIFIAWLLQWLLSFFLNSSRRNRARKQSGPATHMVKDPVCGMYMDSRLALRLNTKGEDVYFCSEDCKSTYLKNPPGSGSEGTVTSR